MKGEEVPPDARWGGNPAREMRVPAALPTGVGATISDGRTGSPYALAGTLTTASCSADLVSGR